MSEIALWLLQRGWPQRSFLTVPMADVPTPFKELVLLHSDNELADCITAAQKIVGNAALPTMHTAAIYCQQLTAARQKISRDKDGSKSLPPLQGKIRYTLGPYKAPSIPSVLAKRSTVRNVQRILLNDSEGLQLIINAATLCAH